jgi:hypothetical protein
MDQTTQTGVVYLIAGLGVLVGLTGGIIAIAVGVKSLCSKPDSNNEVVRRKELDEEIKVVQTSIEILRTEMIDKFEKMTLASERAAMATALQIKELAEYQHKSNHEHKDDLHKLSLMVQKLVVIEELRGRKLAVKKAVNVDEILKKGVSNG